MQSKQASILPVFRVSWWLVGASKNSEVWQQIAFIEKVTALPPGAPPDVVRSSAIEVTVKEKGRFLNALGNAGFSIDSERDRIVARWQNDKNHPFDNAREITKWPKDPEMHMQVTKVTIRGMAQLVFLPLGSCIIS